jgi:hypothetical protein
MMDGGDVDWAAWDAALEKAQQRDVAFPPVRDSDGRANLRQPGFTVAARVTDSARQARRALYDQMDADVSGAWRTPTGVGSGGQLGPRVGDACTVKFGGGRFGAEGSAGTVQLVDGRLVCVADGHDAGELPQRQEIYDPAEGAVRPHGAGYDANALKDAAYSTYDTSLSQQYLRAK